MMLSGKETLKEGGTVVFTKEAKPQEHATEGLKAIKDQEDLENASEHAALAEEKKSQVNSSLGTQEEPMTPTEHALGEVKESQELPFLGVQKELANEQLAHFLDLKGDETEVLIEKYSILIQNELPRKILNLIQVASGSTQEASSEVEAYDPDQPTMEEVNYMGETYGNTYNPSWRNHPNLSWKDQQKPQQGFNSNQGGRTQNRFNNRPPFPSSQRNMETPKQSLPDLVTIVSNLSKTTHSFINETRSSIRNLEVQVGQLSKKIPEIPLDTLPSNTQVNCNDPTSRTS
ncbi:hypothetical protein AHAS_Ahas03G0216900 [Arachis hypogaea]